MVRSALGGESAGICHLHWSLLAFESEDLSLDVVNERYVFCLSERKRKRYSRFGRYMGESPT